MLRKSLFWGLTLVLVVVIVNLVVRGRRLEKEKADQVVEVVQESKPSPTRVLGPQDLDIVQSKMILEGASDMKPQSHAARHEIEIRNNGDVAYGEILLRFSYLDGMGKVRATKTQSVIRTLMPGAALVLSDILIDSIPASTADCRVSVVYADIGHAPEPQIPDPSQ